MVQVIPAIIPHTKEQLENEIKIVKSFTDIVQIDITDGEFVSTKTWPYNGRDEDFWQGLKGEEEGWPFWEQVEIELHLMIKNPEETVGEWIKTGVSTIVFQIEGTNNPEKIIDMCRENSISVGVAIKPLTDESVLVTLVDKIDFIQVMGSGLLGKHHVELEESALEKIKTLHALYPERIIAIDIGVDEDTAEALIEAGATKLISGGFILDASNPREAFETLSSF